MEFDSNYEADNECGNQKEHDGNEEKYDSDYECDEENEDEIEEKQYKCKISGCKASFHKRHRLQQHLNVHQDKRPYKCSHEKCTKSYTNPSHLKRHLQTHQNVAQSYECSECSASMSTINNLKRHYKRAHDSTREMYCHECKLKFRKKSRYEEHVASHKNPGVHKCEKCGKMFASLLRLNRHKQYHVSKNYECPVENCSEIFEKWTQLRKHSKTHKLEYPCQNCDQVFCSRLKLKSHCKTHVENRPAISCPYKNCHRLYYYKRNLNYHIKISHLDKKFECDMCSKKLASKQKIEEHIMKIHMLRKKPISRKSQEDKAKRKDTGQAKRSTLTKLLGIQLSVKAEVKLMQQASTALLRDKAVEENSFSEDDRTSDISAKGA